LMQVTKAVIVMKVQFEKPLRESIQPLPESYLGKDQEMAYVEAKSQLFSEPFPQLCEVIGSGVENIFEANPGIDPVCRFEELAPNPEAVLQPQLLAEGESELIKTGVENDLSRPHLVGKFHNLRETKSCDLKDSGIESAGCKVYKRSVECEFLALFPPSDHRGDMVLGHGVEKFSRQVDLRVKAAAVQKFEVLV
jgi:hypothetical protein